MLQIKNTLGGGKPEGLYAWKKNEIGSELKVFNKSVSTLPFNFACGSAVVLNGEIHILGSDYAGNYAKHYKWNGTSWVSVSTLPYNFHYGAAVIFEDEIHILGGMDNVKKHYKWDGSSWISVGTLPYDFYYGSAVVLNGEIHILGSGNSSYNSMHYKFDGTSWTSVSTLPYSFFRGSAVVYNNEIHVLGSNSSSNTRKYHYRFNGSSWVSVSTLPYYFYEGSAVVFNDKIHLLGGNYDKTAHYNWDGSSWTSVGTLPYTFYDSSAVIFDNGVHILGSSTSNYSTAHYLIIGYTPVYTLLDYVVSDKETAYPDGGVHTDGYYYEKVSEGITPEMFGCTKMAVDEFTPASDKEMASVTLNHSLGVIPRLFIIVADNQDSYIAESYHDTLKLAFVPNWNSASYSNFCSGAVKSNSGANHSYASTSASITFTNCNINSNASYSPGVYYLPAGETYKIYTFA